MIVIGFLLVILAGAFMLWCAVHGEGSSISALDALFMAASAVCVTGLGVVDISKDFGSLSQVIMLSLIQLGGLGFMTGMMMLTIAARRRIGIKGRIFFMGGMGQDNLQGAMRLFFTVVCYTLAIEGAGALLLFAGFVISGEGIARAAYLAIFHAVSAFCNAGYSISPNGMESYSSSLIVPGAVMALIVAGGIGFPVFAEVAERIRSKERRRFSVYSRLVLYMTGGLIAAGAVLFLMSEWNAAFRGMPAWAKCWNALFASITARTAGFSTVPYSSMSGAGQALTVVLMMIGACPASTGGGIKATTLAVLALSVWSELHLRQEPTLWGRTISVRTERRALSIVMIYLLTIAVGSFVLAVVEQMPFSDIIFETVSALSTVGLSVGVTAHLSSAGKLAVIVLMFWGRVGIYSFISTIVTADGSPAIRYPETHIPIG